MQSFNIGKSKKNLPGLNLKHFLAETGLKANLISIQFITNEMNIFQKTVNPIPF